MKQYRFEAALQRSTGWGAYVLFPHSTAAEFQTRGRVPVSALLGGLPYIGSLMPSATGYHRLAVPRAICEQLGKAPGDRIGVKLWKDEEPRTVEVPEEFTESLRKENLLKMFEQLSVTRRKEYRNWIASARREQTRLRRIAQAMDLFRAEKTNHRSA